MKGIIATICLWLILLLNVAAVIGHITSADYAIWIYATKDNARTFFYVEHEKVDFYIHAAYFTAVLSLANVIGVMALLMSRKWGFWTYLGSAVINLALMISFAILGGFSDSVLYSILFSVLCTTIIWTILQIKKNGVSRWRQLK